VTDWVKQEYVSNWLAHCVENLAEDADNDFSVVSYIVKIMFYIRCYPNETIMVRAYELRRRRHELAYSYVQQCQTQFYIQTIA